MNIPTEFVIGEKYTNDQIRFALNLENLGGIRPSVDSHRKLRHLAIITTSETYDKKIYENPYRDKIENDILVYTARGRKGDQEISGRNKRILEQYSSPIPFYGFSNEGKQVYEFLGLLEILRHYQEYQIDQTKSLRRVWIFEFRIHKKIPVIPIQQANELIALILGESRQDEDSIRNEREIVTIEPKNPEVVSIESYETEEIRAQLLQIDPYRFEYLVRDVIARFDFRDVNVTSSSKDGGIDINAYVDDSNYFFSKTHVQFQVKRWRHSVGSVEINNFRGALNTTAKGVFITTSQFTKAAIEEAQHPFKPSISLVDGAKFSKIVRSVDLNLKGYEEVLIG